MDPARLFTGAVQLLILLLAISIRESAHAWVADHCGDSTARELGRITLNPIKHLDLVGSLLLPCVLIFTGGLAFGWGKPAPVAIGKLGNPQRDDMLVRLAGPVSNFLFFLASTLVLAVTVRLLGQEGREAANLALVPVSPEALDSPYVPLMFTLVQMSFLNGFLAVSNLIPIPPLDGGQILLNLMPQDWAAKYAAVRPFGFTIVMGLALFRILFVLALPILVFLSLVINL